MTVLPQFLEVLGRKIDNCEDVLVPSLPYIKLVGFVKYVFLCAESVRAYM